MALLRKYYLVYPPLVVTSLTIGTLSGVMSYVILNGLAWLIKVVTRGRVEPPDYDLKEYWSYKSHSPSSLPWYLKALRGEKRFWEDNDHVMELESVSSANKGQGLRNSQ